MLVDLHCHSTASDGQLPPAAVVERACAQGVQLLALTDHDTLDGLPEAAAAASRLGLQLVSGVEMSCQWNGATVHVLGYGFDPQHPVLQQAIAAMHQARWQRAEEIARRLAARGIDDALAGAVAVQQARGESENAPSRPHFAEFLIQAGHVRDASQAFQRWLGAGRIGDVKQHWPEFATTLASLRDADAWISLAHPCQYNFTRSKRRRLVMDFVRAGGHALEVANGPQVDSQIGTLAIMAREFGLLASAGSDFHGPHPWSELGRYRPLPADLPQLWPHLRDGHLPARPRLTS
jgi:predicted metal-dependent phosphoesterase TrpH